MYKVKKTMEISASHSLHFSKAGVDEPMHGHNWTVTVTRTASSWTSSTLKDASTTT